MTIIKLTFDVFRLFNSSSKHKVTDGLTFVSFHLCSFLFRDISILFQFIAQSIGKVEAATGCAVTDESSRDVHRTSGPIAVDAAGGEGN